MKDIAKAVHTYLQTQSTVTDLCGTRGYPVVAPQSPEVPCYIYSTVSYFPTYSTTGLPAAEALVQVDAVASSYLAAESLRRAIENAVSNYRGAMGDTTVCGCTLDSKRHSYIDPTNGEPFGWFVHSVDLRITFIEG